MDLIPIGGLLLRRAVLGTLLRERRSLTLSEIVEALHRQGVTTASGAAKPPNAVIADLLGYQARVGRVVRVRRGVYAAVPTAFSRTTRWRCAHWHDAVPRSDEF